MPPVRATDSAISPIKRSASRWLSDSSAFKHERKKIRAKGEQGERGIQGVQGAKGEKGDRGEQGVQGVQGVQGIQGERGERGEQGAQGVPGLQGETGSGLEVIDSFDSESQLPSSGSSGDAYFVGNDLFVWSPSRGTWLNKGQIGGGGITGLMSPDPREYFLYVLGESGDIPDTPDEPEVDPAYSPLLDTGKLDYLVLA